MNGIWPVVVLAAMALGAPLAAAKAMPVPWQPPPEKRDDDG